MSTEEARQSELSSNISSAFELQRAGRFSKALQAVQQGPVSAAERRTVDVLKVQLLERTGNYVPSRSLLDSLLRTKDLSHGDRSTCELVAARLDWDSANIDSAIFHLQRSIEAAKRSGELERICWPQLRLLWMLGDKAGLESTSALVAELRANATKLGSAAVFAALHVFLGQMEAQRGLFASARRHTRVGLQVLSGTPNLWLEATAENINFGISVLLSDLNTGLKQGERALQLALESGAASTIGTSLGNLGNLHYLLGHFDEAIDYHQRALALVSAGGENWNASLDSLAQIRLAQGRVDECGALLDEIDTAIKTESDRGRYVYRHTQLTRAKLLHRSGQRNHALAAVESALMLAAKAADNLLASMALLLKAELLIETERVDEPQAILKAIGEDLSQLPPELHAQYERVVGKALSRAAREDEAASHFARAERIYRALGNAPGLLELSTTRADLDGSRANSDSPRGRRTEPNLLQTAATILAQHDRPEILAREIVTLFDHMDAIVSASAVRRTAEGESIIAETNDKPDARQPLSPVERRAFTIGAVGDCKFEVIATCKRDVESLATLNAITVLLNAVHDLEGARAEREERATLWPIDEFPADNGAAVVTGYMSNLMALARRIAPTNVAVLITGESGTGKEILARAIHAFSTRASKAFVPFNCAAIPREMLESQLFGHRRGAFTGADRDQPGVVRAARDGTLFLDEIGEMGLELQPKILRFLESGEISPLGEPSPLTVNVRVVAATNAHLETLVREGRFREDLFYRLNVFRLTINPLRERRDEIPSLVNAFVARAAAEFHKGRMTVAEETMEHLLLCRWPGNVRQLLNEVRRMVALAEPNSTLTPADISGDIRATLPAFPAPNSDGRQIAIPLRDKLMPTLAKIEAEMIKLALHDSGGKVDAAAKALGISRKGLYLKRQRLGL